MASPRNPYPGVDCDCYSVFIGSILTNLSIPFTFRIAAYKGKSYFQHIYPIVIKDDRFYKDRTNRKYYIVLDCVKDDFDTEEPYSKFKDYEMKLEYLDGLEEESYKPETTDAKDLFGAWEEDQEIGSLKSKLRNVKKGLKKFSDKAGNVLRFTRRYAGPGAIMLRNGILLHMKLNMGKAASKLRYAYLSPEQAEKIGMNPAAHQDIKKVLEKTENIYWQAGGKKENLKKAILKGRGNKDGLVPLSGLEGLPEEYEDEEEYQILYGDEDDMHGLGELGVVPAAAIAAAAATMAKITAAIGKVKNFFKGKAPKEPDEASSEEADKASVPENDTADEEAEVQKENNTKPSTRHMQKLPARQENNKSPADNNQNEGFLSKATGWMKENPVKALAITAATIGVVIAVHHLMKEKKKSPSSKNLNGVPKRKKKIKARKYPSGSSNSTLIL